MKPSVTCGPPYVAYRTRIQDLQRIDRHDNHKSEMVIYSRTHIIFIYVGKGVYTRTHILVY